MKLLGVTGLSRSGKDTIANYLVESYKFKKIAFADPLKEGCAAMTGLPLESMYEGDREAVLPDWGFSIRRLLQYVGTEGMRNLDQDFWIKAFSNRIEKHKLQARILRWEPAPVVISDVRFENEANYIRENGGIIISVERPGLTRMDHVSENGITILEDDYVVRNASTFQALYERIDAIVVPYLSH